MSNDEQIAYWNGPAAESWVREQEDLDRVLVHFSDALLARAAARPAERVLDVGCGCGATTVMLARSVGNEGRVIGVDVSRPMLEKARMRAAGMGQVELLLTDASTYATPAPVDLVFSRFGVMFFADPGTAFAHLAAQLRPGGRMVFVCWRPLVENPWAMVPFEAARAVLPPMPPADPAAPGPFALSGRTRLEGVLAAARLEDVRIEPLDADMVLAEKGLDEAVRMAMHTGPTARHARELDDAGRAEVAGAVRDALAPYLSGTRVALRGATWLVSARRASTG
jgi:SAM-dependent methyltransferase